MSGNPIIGDLTIAADAERDAENSALEAGRTTLAEDIESGKASSDEIEDIINMKIDQSDPENQTSAMPPQSLIEEAYKRWAKSVGITDPNLWIQGAIVSSISDGGVEPQEMPEPVATENNDDETAINSGALDTIVSTLKQPAINKILKANENRIN